MNLVKALILTKGKISTFDQAAHGLSEKLVQGGRELRDAYLDAYPSPGGQGRPQVFGEFYRPLYGRNVPVNTRYDLSLLMPQILPGHRLWAHAANKQERFISIHEIRFMQNSSNELWLDLVVVADDLTRLGITRKQFLQESRLSGTFHEVKCTEILDRRKLLRFEQTSRMHFAHRPSDQIQSIVDKFKSNIWVTVNGAQPYRRYYVYLAPRQEHSAVLHQLLSIYAITFYLGSITRYRPQLFDTFLAESFGPRIEEFVSVQPLQFIYLMASEFAMQEVTKPALI